MGPTATRATALLAVILLASVASSVHVQNRDLIITGATLIDGTGRPPRKGTTIIARDGLIAAVGPDSGIDRPTGANVIDASGKYVIPGLADMHVHFSLGTSLPCRANSSPRRSRAFCITASRRSSTSAPRTPVPIQFERSGRGAPRHG